MPRFSQAFRLNKTQPELDFVDVPLHTDIPVFLDPFALSQRVDRWSQECHLTLVTFFQLVVDTIRGGEMQRARELLWHLREPNETRLGFSANRPQGAGIGFLQANQLFRALSESSAVRTGFLSSLEECELMVEGVARDKISDLTTNIIRGHLATYTQEQCDLHSVAVQEVALPPYFNSDTSEWTARHVQLPVWKGRPVLLVPKAVVRYDPAYEHRRYYRHFVLTYLQAEALEAGSALVRTLKNGRQVVYKKDIERRFPCTKEFLYRFSRDHPQVLKKYRKALKRLEKAHKGGEVDPEDDRPIAAGLAQALRTIPRGNQHAPEYHRLMVGMVEFLFFPYLLYPKKESEIHEGRKRIDILMQNGAHSGIFYLLPNIRKLPCAYVAFECKNYETEVGNPELDQLHGRFSVNRGVVGFLCCRHFEDRGLFVRRCNDSLTDGRGLVLPLDDETIMRFLSMIEEGRRKDLDVEFSRLVDEVSL